MTPQVETEEERDLFDQAVEADLRPGHDSDEPEVGDYVQFEGNQLRINTVHANGIIGVEGIRGMLNASKFRPLARGNTWLWTLLESKPRTSSLTFPKPTLNQQWYFTLIRPSTNLPSGFNTTVRCITTRPVTEGLKYRHISVRMACQVALARLYRQLRDTTGFDAAAVAKIAQSHVTRRSVWTNLAGYEVTELDDAFYTTLFRIDLK